MISEVRNDAALVEHLMDLVDLTARCLEENVLVGALARFELMYLGDKLMSVNDSNDAAQLERFTSHVRYLVAYYYALLRSQKRHADDAAHGG